MRPQRFFLVLFYPQGKRPIPVVLLEPRRVRPRFDRRLRLLADRFLSGGFTRGEFVEQCAGLQEAARRRLCELIRYRVAKTARDLEPSQHAALEEVEAGLVRLDEVDRYYLDSDTAGGE